MAELNAIALQNLVNGERLGQYDTLIKQYIATAIADLEANMTVDTDTQYQVVKVDDYNYKLQSKTKDASEWTDVENGAIVIPKFDSSELEMEVDFATESIRVLVDNGNDAGKSVRAIATEVAEANAYDDTEVRGLISALDGEVDGLAAADITIKADIDAINAKIGEVSTDKTVIGLIGEVEDAVEAHKTAIDSTVSTLVGTDTGKSVRTIANEELAAQLIPESAQESLDTLEEIAAWIQAHPGDVATMNAAISQNTTDIDAIETLLNSYSIVSEADINALFATQG